MIFYLHYLLLQSGLSASSVLLGVFLRTYSDASQTEIGILLMSFPFLSLLIRPLVCSLADRHQAHQLYLILTLCIVLIGFTPFVIVPFFVDFYTKTPRLSWYLLVIACQIGLGALSAAWSLGDSLAINMAERTGTPFAQMRLVGTISWGVYGYLIGQINEVSFLPKFVPAFFILHLSILIEIILLSLWDKDDFKMNDSVAEVTPVKDADNNTISALKRSLQQLDLKSIERTPPGSAGGSFRGHFNSSSAIRNVVASDDLVVSLRKIELARMRSNKSTTSGELDALPGNRALADESARNGDTEKGLQKVDKSSNKTQLALLKLMLSADGRLIKYLILSTMFGILLAPMNFVFLNLNELSKVRGYNFSQLAGAILISQAFSETLCFLLVPWLMKRVSRSSALSFGLIILTARYFFYAFYLDRPEISPYSALLGEWGHGIAYAIFVSILADVALMFANQSRLFIPDLRRSGLLSSIEGNNKQSIAAEEFAIRMALRATMQGIFGGFMEGLGQGFGSLICGLVTDAYAYANLWQLVTIIAIVTCTLHQVVELTGSKWSDKYKPPNGSKAFQIMNMNLADEERKGQPS